MVSAAEGGERITDDAEVSTITMPLWRETHLTPTKVLNNPSMSYRVPCTDPRPPFVVGQRVKVARHDVNGRTTGIINKEGEVIQLWPGGMVDVSIGDWVAYLSPWCLDPVEPSPERSVAPHDAEDVLTPEEQQEFAELQKMLTPERLNSGSKALCDPDNDPELDHILRKLKPLTDRAADVRRIKRECYKQLAALLPEER